MKASWPASCRPRIFAVLSATICAAQAARCDFPSPARVSAGCCVLLAASAAACGSGKAWWDGAAARAVLLLAAVHSHVRTVQGALCMLYAGLPESTAAIPNTADQEGWLHGQIQRTALLLTPCACPTCAASEDVQTHLGTVRTAGRKAGVHARPPAAGTRAALQQQTEAQALGRPRSLPAHWPALASLRQEVWTPCPGTPDAAAELCCGQPCLCWPRRPTGWHLPALPAHDKSLRPDLCGDAAVRPIQLEVGVLWTVASLSSSEYRMSH